MSTIFRQAWLAGPVFASSFLHLGSHFVRSGFPAHCILSCLGYSGQSAGNAYFTKSYVEITLRRICGSWAAMKASPVDYLAGLSVSSSASSPADRNKSLPCAYGVLHQSCSLNRVVPRSTNTAPDISKKDPKNPP